MSRLLASGIVTVFTQKPRILVGMVAVVLIISARQEPVQATPLLQLYMEGGTYNTQTESWEITPVGSSSGAPFRIWTIGNLTGNGGKGPISDVKLSAVYNTSVGDLIITLTPSTTGGLNGFTDPSTPSVPLFLQEVDGSVPKLGDGSNLPTHGVYGDGRTWQEFSLGDFDDPDSPLADFNGTVADPVPTNTGDVAQINVYEVSVAPAPGTEFGEHPFTIHFDLYNHIEAKNHSSYKFAPFSHDADGDSTIVPEPASVTLLSIGLLGCLGVGFRRRKNAA